MTHRMQEKRSSIWMAALLASVVCLVLSAPTRSVSESFEGETDRLRKLTPQERFNYFGLQYVMNQFQKKHFLGLGTGGERREWIERFWIDLDPTPTTEANERRIEHEKRVRLARKLFSKKKAPGWDKRGETLIRFGWPNRRIETFGNIGFYRMIPPGEIWYYESLDMLVEFHNFSLSGEFVYAINPLGRTGRENADRWKSVHDMSGSGNVREILPVEVLSLEEIEDIVAFNPDEIDYIADSDIRIRQPKDLIAIIEQEKYNRSVNNFYKFMKEQPLVYSFEIEQDLLPVAFDITAFRGGPGTIRTEINFEIPSSEVNFIRKEGVLSAGIDLRVVAWDINMKEIERGGDRINAAQKGGEIFIGPSHLPGQVILTLKPGYYRIGIEAYDTNSGRRGVYRTNLELAPLGETLGLSDIQYASSIRETTENVKFAKGNLQVVPHPLRAYRRPFPVHLYFEIYGLDTDKAGLAFYTVEYRIIPLEKRRKGPVFEDIQPAISSRFETSGFGGRQVQRLTIATENLWKGSFRLVVSVKDRRTFQVVEGGSKFSILD